jgi:hypothetical protein
MIGMNPLLPFLSLLEVSFSMKVWFSPSRKREREREKGSESEVTKSDEEALNISIYSKNGFVCV